ncbi:chaoptin-like [Diachasma alloeum]|uniref:chaoptin-like n=1 Tax=Diachasma alloeum TaxID=454923 RepID=UPI0010FB11F4|nr:chaoptin-like [Diachasma alloeum]
MDSVMAFTAGSLKNLKVLHVDHNPLKKVCGMAACRRGIWLGDAINLQELSLSFANLSILENNAMENLTSLKYLDISNNELSKIPEWSFKNLISLLVLKLDGNALTDIPDLGNLEKLEELNLSCNALHDITQQTFCKLINLKHLDLSHNEITEMPSGVFDMLASLATLDLSWNKLIKLPQYLFVARSDRGFVGNSMNLERLNLSHNELSEIPQRVFQNLTSLVVLKLDNNKLLDIPDLCNLKKLREVNLSGNAFYDINQQTFCNLTNLKYIDLSHNEIADIRHGVFDTLAPLTTLDLSWNKIKKLRRNWFNPGSDQVPVEHPMNLEYLDLSNNNMRKIPRWAFQNVTSLVILKLNNNVLKDIPNLCSLKKMEEFNFSHNDLQNISQNTFCDLLNLRHIDLAHNQINKITPEVVDIQRVSRSDQTPFANLTNLEYLDISNNNLSRIPRQAFENLTSLLILKLGNNELKNIPRLCHLRKLEKLNLSGNALHDISQRTFCNSTNLTHIDFSHNEIAEIIPGVFDKLSSLTTLDLSWNKLINVTKVGDSGALQHLKYLNLAGNVLPVNLLSFFTSPSVETLVLDETIAGIQLPRNTSADDVSIILENSPYIPTMQSQSMERTNITYALKIEQKFPQLRHLYLRKNNLESMWIPSWSDILPKITHLYLSNNNLTSTSFLSTFPETLTHLYLDKNRLQTFMTGWLMNLRVLHLDHNSLGQVCASEFCTQGVQLRTATHLQELSISFANISKLGIDSMDNQIYLEYLNLSNNNISRILQRVFKYVESLKILKLDYNVLTEIPILSTLKKLETLNLSCNAIHNVGQKIFIDLPNLKHIDLSYNKITHIKPEAFDMLPSLTTLNISSNQLTELPSYWIFPRIQRGPSENSVDLKNPDTSNVSTEIPFGLKVLNLANNSFTDIPDLRNFKKLEELDVSHNALRNIIQQTFRNLTHLRHVNLSHNGIAAIRLEVFEMLPSLTTLDLSWNRYKKWLSSQVSSKIRLALKVLKLEHNGLMAIPDLCHFDNLEELDLSHNAVQSIRQQNFCNLKHLKHIDLSNNKIVEIKSDIFEMLPSLRTVDVSWNKLRKIVPRQFAQRRSNSLDVSIKLREKFLSSLNIFRPKFILNNVTN